MSPTDPEPHDEELDVLRGYMAEYGSTGISEMLAVILFEPDEDGVLHGHSVALAMAIDRVNGSLRWPELRRTKNEE